MRWCNFVTLSEVLWLSCLSSGSASILPKESLVLRQTPPNQNGFVYRGDGRSPRDIRGTGGFQPQGDGWEDYDPSFDLDRHYTAGPNGCGLDDFDEPHFVFRTAYVSTALEQPTAETYGQWLYEIRATPNILDNDFSEGEVMALGGIHWRQIRRYTRMRDTTDNRVDEASWIDNPEYDAETYERGPNASRCRVSTTFPSVLAGDSDNTDSDSSNSDNESNETTPPRRLFSAADRFMDQTPGVFELYGGFPPSFTQYAPRDDVPGPDHPAPPEAADAQVGSLLQHYIDMGAQELDRLFPDGNQMLQELLRDISPVGCPSLTGFGSHLGRSNLRVDQRARRGAQLDVDICKNSPLNPPCTTTKAPRGKCVAVPQEYKDNVSGVKVHDTAGICRFYLKPECQGEYFEGGHHGVDLYQSRPKFNDKVASFLCNTLKLDAAPERWEWAPESEKALCARVDKLSFDFELANNYGSGTYDKIKLDFKGAGQKPHVIVEGPSPGYKTSQEIDMVDIFGMETVALDQIKRLRLLDEITDHWFGGDPWDVFGITLKARCAGSEIDIVLDKFASLNKELQAKPTEPGRFQYNRDWQAWADNVDTKNWAAKPLCSHFQSLDINLHIADANWAGTDNNLYAKVGEGRFLLARHPSRREVFTVDIDLKKAYSTKLVPVPKVELVGISSEGGNDAVLPSEVTVYGICSGAHTSLSVKQEIKDWVYDGQQLNIKLTPEMWVKV
ncbi:Heat-labile enterotoxin, A chain [Akanthomyces lecanii RCEF 1005]|uniref:Heat-labile enterotoxin, A chain n=1 Tax=Akanthomyces lecanii RCEF 1005 TaxID=1081108 RepID=A0A162KVH9_CORDF|nr:Heat-labile enterotoxin, A chain [Akanthomyces lecanii RCEF 1005]